MEYKLSIKYLGEEGLDTGALSREFLAVISDIAKIVFPNGSPVHSTQLTKKNYKSNQFGRLITRPERVTT